MRLLGILATVTLLAACARPPAGTLRFHNAPPVWRVDDARPLAQAPAEREYNRSLYHVDGFGVRRITRALDVKPAVRARDVNALDEVPDSTWFTNRIGIRDLAVDELRRGANLAASPFDHLPWRITGGKVGGLSIGYIFEDARGDKYILKFDAANRPEMETAAHVIGHRILWAAGYNVPEDYIGYVRPSDIAIDPEASSKDEFGDKTPLTRARFEKSLAPIARERDGRLRVLASRFLPGKPIGPYAREGTRPDDPNDRIRHEQRRSIRGQVPLFAWLNHTDIQEDNTLDAFVLGPDKKTGHVVHYLIDFGKALGVMGYGLQWKTVGYTYRVDPVVALKTLLTLGLWKRPWDEVDRPPLLGIGLYESANYDPADWQTNSPYWPFHEMDRIDGFWGAKLAMRFTREQLAAVVDEARYSDPRSAAYMLETLVDRQRKTARYWFDRVSPLDELRLEGGSRLCFTDLLLAYRLQAVSSRYRVQTYDRGGAPFGAEQRVRAPDDGRACVEVPLARDYTIVQLQALRNARALPDVLVHIAPDATGAPRIIGVRRR